MLILVTLVFIKFLTRTSHFISDVAATPNTVLTSTVRLARGLARELVGGAAAGAAARIHLGPVDAARARPAGSSESGSGRMRHPGGKTAVVGVVVVT